MAFRWRRRAALALWVLLPVRYEAIAELLVRSQEDRLLPAMDGRSRERFGSADYDIFRQTQASLITSTFVLNSVLRDPVIQRLSMLNEKDVPNPIGYLQDNIEAEYPNDAEVLRVSMRGENPVELKKLVDAVTDAYLEETVYNRERDLTQRMHNLGEEYNTNRDNIRTMRESIHTRQIQLGASDSSRPHIRHQLELERLRDLEGTRSTLQSRLHEIDLKLALAQAIEDNRSEVELPEYLIAEELERDEQYNRLVAEMDAAQQAYTSVASAARSTSPSVQRAAAQTELISAQMAARRRQLGRRIEQKVFDKATDQGNDETTLALLAAEREILQRRHTTVKQAHEDQLEYVRQLDGFSATLQSDRDELAYALRMNQARHAEIEDIKVQLASPDRITKIQNATIPNSNSRQSKLIQVICSAFVVLGLTGAAFIGWDVTQRRINIAAEAAQASEAPVLGRLPLLRARWPMRQIPKNRIESVVGESMDGIRTALQRGGDEQGANIIMVTSAVGGEGKTVLANQLAISFAYGGQRTLLIDADTSRAQQHAIFGLDGTHGFCDGLREGGNTAAYVQRTPYDGLDLLPAGRRDAASQKALANHSLESCLSELRAAYDIVLIDTGPVLTSAEPLMIGRSADEIILSAMRDVSQSTRVAEARERLSAVGLELSGVVVQGVPVATRRDHSAALVGTGHAQETSA